MTKLEPTRTSSDLTATERLRELLDERGVEWTNPNSCLRDEMTSWVANRFDYDAFEVPDGTLVLSAAHQDDLTPEQAIAATLGSCNCSNSERMNAPRLPHFWTHDGTLHIEATRMPTRIVVCEGGTCEFVPKRELDASEAENAKLRELVASLTDRSIRIADKMDCLEAENVKLRELVRDYEHCSMHADCDSCKYDGTTSTHCPFSPCFPGIDELCELGVEVDA